MHNIFSIFYIYARPLIKWFLRHLTRLCELQRICYGSEFGSARNKGVEDSLALSRQPQIKLLLNTFDKHVSSETTNEEIHCEFVPYAIGTVLKVKQIKPQIHPDFAPIFANCIETILGYRRLYARVELTRSIQYDSNNPEHEIKLLKLWELLMPDQELEARITKQWQDIGFQGDNPMSDFRGMGLLGLDNLIYFAEEYNGAARHVLSHSLHPRHGYTFAIVGINLTAMAYNLLKNGAAKTHLYNLDIQYLDIEHFHKLYCYLFYEFDKYWMECKPVSLMDFSNIHEKFLMNILSKLDDNRTVFKINLSVDNI